ncbi:MAG: hypothetical protein RL653_451 [Pseudomonadota bacterium]
MITSKHTRVALIGTLLAAATAGAESGPFNLHFEPGLAASLADFRSGQAKQVGAGPGFDFAAKLDIPVYKGLAVQVMASTQALPVEVRRSNLYAVGAGVRWRFVDDHKGYRFHMPGDPKTGNWLGNYWVDAAVLTTGEQKLGTLGVELGMGAEASLVDGLQAGPLLKFTYADQLLTTTLGISISIAKDPGEAQDKDNDGFVDEKDKCPAEAEDKDGFQDDDGCPEADNDADGIADAADKCPGEAEDKDGFQDDDGCPEKDNDNDGIPDAADKCPVEPETVNGKDDTDGCPEKEATVFITKEKVTITDKVFFNVGKSTLQSKSEALLTEVANVLVKFPRVKKVRVEGHTDNTGKAEKNLKLSSERAKAVVDFLVKKGVAKERLEAVGYGAEKPLDSADTEEAREKNRRVEFTILEQDAAE